MTPDILLGNFTFLENLMLAAIGYSPAITHPTAEDRDCYRYVIQQHNILIYNADDMLLCTYWHNERVLERYFRSSSKISIGISLQIKIHDKLTALNQLTDKEFDSVPSRFSRVKSC